ncbi:hypothetical protein EC957_009880 [Mortierella hygrophila]|uniref:F-box domain-containing protein n=1 Tax=Mortierella hygrophila TaxID=979708 RepID=A0A9P6FBE8_9FUNG|nr:hypothetical protein EC957_009880 [Mortierella hygrophila]
MNVLGMSDHHFRVKSGQTLPASPSQSSSLPSSTLSSSLPSKPKGKDSSSASGLINSLKKKSSASTLFSPLSPALFSTGPSTTFTSSLTRSKRSSSRRPLCSASCFSPLDLPSDIFVCLLEFLTPAELWKLSMASREMYRQVNGFMSKIQRFKYSAVRILHQENSGIMYVSPSGVNGGSPSPVQTILARIKGASNPRSRQSYWEAQGELMVMIIMGGTPYEPKPGSQPVKETSTKSSARAHSPQIHANSADTTVTITPLLDNGATTTPPSSTMTTTSTAITTTIMPTSPSTSTLVSSYASASSSQLSLGSTANKTTADDTVQVLGPLPMDRFQAMVDLLFDPNIVYLNHRRAIINCARYVSASIAEYFKEALSTKDPLDPVFHALFLKQYTVRTGPYLALILYDTSAEDNGNDEEDGLPQEPFTQAKPSQRSTLVAPPSRLQKYFQAMLWHRCMSDLIALYNRIQRLHVDITPSPSSKKTCPEPLEPMPESNRAVCCQDMPTSIPSPTASPVMQESYPFCCNAHSLVFTTHYPASVPLPYPIRQKLRRMAQKLQTKNLWATILQSHGINAAQWEECSIGGHIQYTGSTEKLQFCNGVARPISPATMAAVAASGSATSSSSSIHKQRREMDDEELVLRRHRIEERIRQDTLMKQELLSLCLMACGLFMVDSRSRHIPPTLMSLLRRYGPWDKGVWREGEWRRSAIDLSSGTGSEKGAGGSHKKKSMSPSSSLNISSLRGGAATVDGVKAEGAAKEDNKNERGPWQNLCIAAIQFMAHEDLTWGGATGNEELSRLRVTINSSQWIYHE